MRLIKRILIYSLLNIVALQLISCASSRDEIDIEDETAQSLLEKGNMALAAGNPKKAFEISQMFLTYFPTSDLHIDAQLLQANALGGLEKYEDQMELLLRLPKENIIPERIPKIYIQIAEFYETAATWNPNTVTTDTSDLTKAAKWYRKAVFYPDSDDNESKAQALYRAALTYAKLRQYDIAKRAYEQTIAFYSDSKFSAMAKIKLLDVTDTNEIDPNSEIYKQFEASIQKPVVQEEQITEPPEKKPEDTEIKGAEELLQETEQETPPVENNQMENETSEPDTSNSVNDY